MIPSIAGPFKTGYLKFVSRPFISIPIVVGIYLLANGGAHFPNWGTSHRDLIIVYMVMVLAFLTISNKEAMKEAMRPLKFSAFSFVGLFALTVVVVNLIVQSGFLTTMTFDKSLFWQTVVVQICVVATAEELMFRGFLLNYVGVFLSSLAFAFWHSYAYSVIWYDLTLTGTEVIIPLVMAFLFGLLLAYVSRVKTIGLPGAIGIHSAYNLVIIGVLIL